MTTQKRFSELLDAPLQELYRLRNQDRFEYSDNSIHVLYVDALIGYLSGDGPSLSKAADQLRSFQTEESGLAADLASLRSEIRSRAIKRKSLLSLCRKFSLLNQLLPHWLGEAHFVLGRAYEILEQHVQAIGHYRRAYRHFEAQGCKKKAVKCLLDQVASKSRIHQEGSYISEYHEIVRLARKANEYGMAGVALMNISRELQGSGVLRAALQYANRAVMFMSRDVGTLHYYLALIHRSHLNWDLGRAHEANADYEAARVSKNREILEALPHLEARLSGKTHTILSTEHLTPGWRQRFRLEKSQEQPLAGKESELMQLLITAPRSKKELISALWGKNGDPASLELRFKRLLNRVRKKRKEYVFFDGKHYQISDRSFLTPLPPELKSAARIG